MAEPRARPRAKGQLFTTPDLTELLYAFGSNPPQLPLTIAILDEILTDFIIETCHAAALCASYSRRQKIKVDDFKWVLRKDEALLGRVLEQLWKEKAIKVERRVVDFESVGREGVGELEGLAEIGGVERGEGGGAGRGRGKGRGRGGRRKRKAEEEIGGGGKRVAM